MEHPGLLGTSSVEILTGQTEATPLHEVYDYDLTWGFPSVADRTEIARLMTETAPQGGAEKHGDASAPVAASFAAGTA